MNLSCPFTEDGISKPGPLIFVAGGKDLVFLVVTASSLSQTEVLV